MREEDPDFGKVRNDDPSIEFAFELRSDSLVPTILEMSEGCRDLPIMAVDDYGAPVTCVPIGATSYAIFFDLVSCRIELKTKDASLPIRDFMHALSCGIVDCVDGLELSPRQKKKLKSLRMSRFYYCSPGSWWTFTHG